MLENLNPEQIRAVKTTEGPLLVLSGAGTGKTRVLTTRIAYILNNDLALPWQILALTFTNKAANEMKNRIAAFGASGVAWNARDLWCGTFHSVALRILRANAESLGLRRDFIIYGEDEQKSVLKSVLADMGLDTKDFNPSDWVERISAIKDRGLNPPESISDIARKILDAYNAELTRLSALDFGDIILKVLQLFDKCTDVLARYQRQFKYILVDEFQDTNNAQMQMLEFLTRDKDAPNICCVGDDDQSIYSWRGAEIKHILNFEHTYPNAQIIRLETNYRSTGNILGAANSLIRHNNNRLGKDLRTSGTGDGEPVYIITLPSDLDEARFIADTIIHESKGNYSNFAILIRAGSLSRLFEEEFARRNIPYRLIGATKFYDRMEIRDAIAYLRLMVYPFDDISFMRVIGKPRRGIGASTIEKMRTMGMPLMDALRTDAVPRSKRAVIDEFLSAFNIDWQNMPPMDAANQLLENTGYMKMWRESRDVDAGARIDNLRELITNVISKYDSMPEFLEQAALMMTEDDEGADARDNANAVSVMTMHAAKGLEFNTVFLPAWEDGIFPNEMTVNEGALEEERRLAYVAITRARRLLVITNATSRMVFGQREYNSPSRFITEMDNKYLVFRGCGVPRSYNTYNAPINRVREKIEKKSAVGCLVKHDEMGQGVVIEDNGDILTIAFSGRGIKKVARDYVKFIN